MALRRALTTLLCMAALGSMAAPVAPSRNVKGQLNDTQGELDALHQKIEALQRSVGASEQSRKDASDALQQSEQAISQTNRTLADLQDEQDQLEDQLKQLGQQQQQLSKRVQQQKQALAQKLRAQYRHSNSDTLQLLLNADDPNTASRDLAYLRYIAKAHQQQISKLKADLQTLVATRSQIEQNQQRLQAIASQRIQEKQALENQRTQRKHVLNQLDNQLLAQRQQMEKWQRDENRLGNLVEQLNRIVAEQERQRQARLKAEAEAAQRARLLAQQKANRGKPATNGKPAPVKPSKPETSTPVETNNNRVTLPVDSAQVSGNAQNLKGRLLTPVSGSPSNRFGAPRADSGVAWRGWFYPAAEGSDIRSVAAGQVVYADWLRGFGNMVIVDHGGGLMSIYGSTESVLRRVGDRVDAGQVIARTGNSGGSDKSGLYFELRFRGKAFDPSGWLRG